MKSLIFGLILSLSLFASSANAIELRAVERGGGYGIEAAHNGTVLLSSLDQGLWSIAHGWQDDWPADWRHAFANRVERHGEWTVLTGRIETGQGEWRLRDAYRLKDGLIECRRRFEWHGDAPADPCTLSLRFHTPATGNGVLMPGILYYGNPSGAKSGRTPVFDGNPGEWAMFEEHRFPMPFVSMEWAEGDSRWGAALHSLPSPLPYANVDDLWWSLGAAGRENGTELALLSGPCASNGERGVIKARQSGFSRYPDAYLSVPPRAIIEKTVYLQVFPVKREGAGFQPALKSSLALTQPYSLVDMPSFEEIIRDKYRFALTRWHEEGGASGFKKYPDRPYYVIGWCGQAAAPGYALQALDEGIDDPAIPAMVQKSLDFLSQAEFYDQGFHTWYNYETSEWSRHEPLSQGQGMLNIARAIVAAESDPDLDSSEWKTFLNKAAAFHSDRILSDDWRPVSTDEAFFIAPLCYAHRLFGDQRFLEAALKAGEHYVERHGAMREPYWGGTLDASCEDKEGAFAALQGFLELYETTDDGRWLTWAEHACDVALTYTVTWNIDMPAGRLRDHGFQTRGWTAVSPQNQHIDVFGVLIAPDIYRLGRHLKRDDYKQLALVMVRSCGQLIDPFGSQGEQPQQTNYAQRGEIDDIYALRGGYNETWTVFWITAHFLNAAAQFDELGVDIWDAES